MFNKRTLPFVLLASIVGGSAFAADQASHQVTVIVEAINELAISGGDIVLTIASAVQGQDPDPVSNSDASLNWTTNESDKKIVVETDLAAPLFDLSVEASNISGGTAAGSVAISTTAQDFVTGISLTSGDCSLLYTAEAEAADGTGTDVHNITYTLIDA